MRFLLRRWRAWSSALRAKAATDPTVVLDDEWADAIVPADLSPRQRERFEAAAGRALARRRVGNASDQNGGE